MKIKNVKPVQSAKKHCSVVGQAKKRIKISFDTISV